MIGIGSDHGGFSLKKTVIQHLKEKGYKVKDYGCYSEEPKGIKKNEQTGTNKSNNRKK